jgi:hypothetical protein
MPVNYFLVLTSVIVHGITIPVGKGFQHARTLTRSQTATGLVESGGVSRLPPAVPLGTKTLPTHSRPGTPPGSGANTPTIRFQVPVVPADLQRQVDAQVEAESSELNQNIVGVEHESGGGK